MNINELTTQELSVLKQALFSHAANSNDILRKTVALSDFAVSKITEERDVAYKLYRALGGTGSYAYSAPLTRSEDGTRH